MLGTRPAAGADAAWGSPVSLLVADYLTVPAVRGLPTAEAEKTLESAGFDVTVGDPAFDAEMDAGRRAAHRPVAGRAGGSARPPRCSSCRRTRSPSPT